MKEIVLDTETTGLSPASDKIIEIACIEIENHLPTGKKFHAFVNPGMDISEGVIKLISQSTLMINPNLMK